MHAKTPSPSDPRRSAYFGRNQARPTASRAERTSRKRGRVISLFLRRSQGGEPQSRKAAKVRVRRSSEEKVGVFRSKPSEADGESRGAYFPYAMTSHFVASPTKLGERAAKPQCRKGGNQRWRPRSSAEKVGVFRSKPSEADGESRGAYFPYASTLDVGIAPGSTERRRPSSRDREGSTERRRPSSRDREGSTERRRPSAFYSRTSLTSASSVFLASPSTIIVLGW
jgi:hypothetical protein